MWSADYFVFAWSVGLKFWVFGFWVLLIHQARVGGLGGVGWGLWHGRFGIWVRQEYLVPGLVALVVALWSRLLVVFEGVSTVCDYRFGIGLEVDCGCGWWWSLVVSDVMEVRIMGCWSLVLAC